MNSSDLLLTAPVMPPSKLETISSVGPAARTGSAARPAEAKKTEQAAKDFESVFLTKVLDEMKNTIGNGLGEEEAGSEQIKGLFWFCLARDMADKGGFGLWKDLNRFFNDMQKTNAPASSLDEKL
jgi:Rod binding domain-containing protein